MNDHARDVLAKHAMLGTKQAFNTMRDVHGGMCALGVLMYELLGEARACNTSEERKLWLRTYQVTRREEQEILDANDKLKWDFLTISRKCGNGVQEEVAKEA